MYESERKTEKGRARGESKTHEGETKLVLSHVLPDGVTAIVVVRPLSDDRSDWKGRRKR
jgi:hypothetical protein